MIEPEEDKLYSELRHKLADYESPPPPAVWPGVQRHLASRRRPRRLLALLLILGLLGAGLYASWPWLRAPTTSPDKPIAAAPANSPARRSAESQLGAALSAPVALPSGSMVASAREAAPAAAAPTSPAQPTAAAQQQNRASAPGSMACARTKNHPLAAKPTLEAEQPNAQHFAMQPRDATRSEQQLTAMPRPNAAAAAAASADTESTARTPKLRSSSSASQGLPPFVQPQPLVLLSMRMVQLARPLPAVAQPHRVPEPHRDSVLIRGWVLQALAGPALTYRTLGATPAHSVASLERPALTYAGHLNVGYVFSPKLLLTVGVGYAAYATRLHLQLQTDSSVNRLRSRDTYHLLQVPVQARYWLGSYKALRYGITGGVVMNTLLGGRTTEGAACACQQTPIVLSDTTRTYHRFGLGLTVGAQAAYRLNARWSALLQPSFYYSLTPAAEAGSGLPRRRLWGVSLQAGLSLNLP